MNRELLRKSNFNDSNYSRLYSKYTYKTHIHVQFCKTDFIQKRILNMKMKLYNKVPTTQKHWTSIGSVKRDLRSFLLQRNFYSVKERILC